MMINIPSVDAVMLIYDDDYFDEHAQYLAKMKMMLLITIQSCEDEGADPLLSLKQWKKGAERNKQWTDIDYNP
jgi:hypothetical protein